MTDTIPTAHGDLVVWTTADPQSLPAASAAMMTSVAEALDATLGNYTTAAGLLAATPAFPGYYTATNVPGAFFLWDGSSWSMHGIGHFTSSASRNTALSAPMPGWLSRIDTERFIRVSTGVGTNWNPYGSGFFPIVPTASSGSISASGLVSFSAAAGVSIDGISGFDEYLLEISILGTLAHNLTYRFRSSSADNMTPNYDNEVGYDSVTARTVVQINGAPNGTATGSNQAHRAAMRLSNLNASLATLVLTDSTDYSTTGNSVIRSNHGGSFRLATPFTGISFAPTAGTITGTIRVMGISW